MSSSYSLVYKQFGNPSDVIEKVVDEMTASSTPTPDEVIVEMLASTINPADLLAIQGVYAIKPNLPAIGGNEGVGRVLKIGSAVNQLAPGDWVLPTKSLSGTWRNYAKGSELDWIKIDNDIDLMAAAQLAVNPCTAYRMLKDFVPLKQGDVVIQNGANSAVGLNVIQLAREWGLVTVNVIRGNRPNLEELRESLKSLGANFVVTEDELHSAEFMDKIWSQTNNQKPKLALDCVGGKNASDCIRYLGFRGVMVTYGRMSKEPLTIPQGSLIFNDHKFVGFWVTRWNQESGQQERKKMYTYLCELIKAGKLETPKTIKVSLDNYKDALEQATKGMKDSKVVFVMK